MRMQRGIFLVFLMASLSACVSSRSPGIADAPASPAAPSVIASTLNGGLVSRAGLGEMSRADLDRALEAEYRALEYGAAGMPVAWRGGSSLSGEVTAAQPYRVGSQDCRSYMHVVRSNNTARTLRGTACRNPDGSWTPLT